MSETTNWAEVARVCRQGAKLYEGFKAGEELASRMDQGEQAMGNLQSAILTLQKEYGQLRVAVEAAKTEADTVVRDAKARADSLVLEARDHTIPAERTKQLADAAEAQKELRRAQDIWKQAQIAQTQALALREQDVGRRETNVTSREHDLASEAARQGRLREDARAALAKVSTP